MKVIKLMKNGRQIYGDTYYEYAHYFREIALDIEKNPNEIIKHYSHPAIQELILDEHSTCLERVRRLEALCYGDAGVMLACPGPSLSGLIIREIGSEAQKKLFFEHVQSQQARTLFAITEPKCGSAAQQIEATMRATQDDRYFLSGQKCLFGNGFFASIGVIFAKISHGPLGLRAILLTPQNLLNNPKVQLKLLKSFALKGAALSYLEVDELEIHPEQILGQHLSAIQTGMLAIITTFNRMRPGVAAIALGQAQAQFDYMLSHTKQVRTKRSHQFEGLNCKLMTTRNLLHKIAINVEKNPRDQSQSSMIKILATQLAEEITQVNLDYFGRSLFYEHPLLAKWVRDVYGFEFMEGTSNIHLQNIFNHYRQKHVASF